MTSQGRQYPDGPLEPPPGWPALRLEIPADPGSVPEHFWDEPPWEPIRWPEDAEPGRCEFILGDVRPPGPRVEITADFCQCPACLPGQPLSLLAALDRLFDMIAAEPLSIDPCCPCAACREARCEP